MDRSTPIKLIAITYTADSIGQLIPTESERKVYCNLSSVTRAEFFAAGDSGFRPELRVTMFAPDYKGEEIVEYNSVRYSVYRTFVGSTDTIELYLEKKVGV